MILENGRKIMEYAAFECKFILSLFVCAFFSNVRHREVLVGQTIPQEPFPGSVFPIEAVGGIGPDPLCAGTFHVEKDIPGGIVHPHGLIAV